VFLALLLQAWLRLLLLSRSCLQEELRACWHCRSSAAVQVSLLRLY
jgi:hypothetical protein